MITADELVNDGVILDSERCVWDVLCSSYSGWCFRHDIMVNNGLWFGSCNDGGVVVSGRVSGVSLILKYYKDILLFPGNWGNRNIRYDWFNYWGCGLFDGVIGVYGVDNRVVVFCGDINVVNGVLYNLENFIRRDKAFNLYFSECIYFACYNNELCVVDVMSITLGDIVKDVGN